MIHFIIWEEAFSVGNKKLDEHHQQIVGILNKLYVAKQERSLVTPRDVMDLLERYTETHFSYEEDLMKAAGYPELEGHVKSHSWMTQKTRELAADVISNSDALTDDVFDFLKKWWISHINIADRKYAPYVQKLKYE
jgi:hemerythrin